MNFEKKSHPSSVILAELFPQNILSPEGRCIAYPVGVQLFLLMFYFGLGKVYWISKTNTVYRIFLSWKCFIPRREMHSISSRGPIVFIYVLFWVGNDFDTFKITLLRWPFFFSWKCFTSGLDWVGWDVGRNIKSVLQFSLYFVSI